jgi:hypothetical protein
MLWDCASARAPARVNRPIEVAAPEGDGAIIDREIGTIFSHTFIDCDIDGRKR